MTEAGRAAAPREWGVRIGSALVLAAVSFAALYWSGWAFAVFALVVAVAALWEWSCLLRGTGRDGAALASMVAVAIAIALLLWASERSIAYAIALVALVGGAIMSFVLSRERRGWSAFGVFYAGLPCLALVALRLVSADGWLAVLFVIAVVAATDTGGFVFGRLIGGPKLWPRVSPKKTWAGFLGGAACAMATGFALAAAISHAMPIRMVAIAALLSVMSVFGDLFESAIKRRFGRKDMSALIPGHGGVLDRVDGLIFAIVAGFALALTVNWAAPAEAVLGWPTALSAGPVL